MNQTEKHPSPPMTELLKTIPDMIGLRLNQQPDYTVIASDGDFEIRHYERTYLAQVSESGNRDEALKKGFHRLADYIFGKNSSNVENEEPHSVKMAMTAPVFHEEKDGKWLISFVIPAKYHISNVPRPLDTEIHLVEKNPKEVAVVTYSGTNNDEKMREHQASLQLWLDHKKIKTTSGFYFAQYDPPFTVPLFKRNEVFVKVDYPTSPHQI
ncbi:MAG: heme-binding protein [Bdellovibrionaceae bacterium]|nr:heme-binding protein [Pseudobdellovibrionaceae bacterium]